MSIIKESKGLTIISETSNERAMEIVKRFKAIKFVDEIGGVNHEQVAEFYGVDIGAIKNGVWQRKSDILIELGSKPYSFKELKSYEQFTNAKINSQGMVLHSAKSVLFIAFQLTESEIAKSIVNEVLSIALGEKDSPVQKDKWDTLLETYKAFGASEEIMQVARLGVEQSRKTERLYIEQKEYVDHVVHNDKYYITPTTIANKFGMSARRLNEILVTLNVQYKQGAKWCLKRDYYGIGDYCYFQKPNGEYEKGTSLRYSNEGERILFKTLTAHGYEPKVGE